MTKDGIDITSFPSYIRGEMLLPLLIAKGWREKNSFEEVVVTSITDGIHSPGTLHTEGLAVDLRTRDLTAKQKVSYYMYIKENLTKYYEVFIEANHIHVEYDTHAK